LATATRTGAPDGAGAGTAPPRASLVLVALIVVAAVANLNLTVANVALPDIGRAFDTGQTALDLIAIGYSLGLAGSVLYLGAVGDRYGRRMMLVAGVLLSVPACLLAAYAPDPGVLLAGRLLGGISAGMAYPTTLALISALWSGPARIRAIALWSGIGGAVTALGPMLAGLVLQHFWWGSAFLLTLPLAAVALVLALTCVPSHVNETTETVDRLGVPGHHRRRAARRGAGVLQVPAPGGRGGTAGAVPRRRPAVAGQARAAQARGSQDCSS